MAEAAFGGLIAGRYFQFARGVLGRVDFLPSIAPQGCRRSPHGVGLPLRRFPDFGRRGAFVSALAFLDPRSRFVFSGAGSVSGALAFVEWIVLLLMSGLPIWHQFRQTRYAFQELVLVCTSSETAFLT